MRSLHRTAAVAGALLLVPACASAPGERVSDARADEGRNLITAQEIRESGSNSAWEALRRVGRISMIETARGEPSSMKLRGSRSLVLNETPLVVLNGVPTRDVGVLKTIRADIIEWIEILDAADGARHHGPMAGGGAIVIRTKTGAATKGG